MNKKVIIADSSPLIGLALIGQSDNGIFIFRNHLKSPAWNIISGESEISLHSAL